MNVRDFKRLFYHEKVLWYSIKTLFNLKKSLVVFNQDFLSFKKVMRYLIKTHHHLKKSCDIQNHSNFKGLFNKYDFDGFCGSSL